MTMHAITVKQPWAAAIAALGKDVENRSWTTNYRGRLAIHAGKSWDHTGHRAAETLAGQHLPPAAGGPAWASGALIAVVDLVDVDHCDGRCSPWAIPDSYHWQLANVRALTTPLPCRGALKLWPVPAELAVHLPS